jgi:glycosyltransferase involved in cell wall biosynthesis
MPPIKVAFLAVLPSPYQRDLFAALATRPELDVSVYYMEAETPDSPWPDAALRPFETILPGRCTTIRGARVHMNWPLPNFAGADFVVLNTFSSLTAQMLMRGPLRNKTWLFWGEVLRPQPPGWRDLAQRRLLSPLRHSAGIVAIGQRAQADYQRRYPQLPLFCIPYHCTLEAFLALPRRDQQTKPFRFFFCGQMIRRKGVDLLIEAFDRLVQLGLDVELGLVGREADLPEFLTAASSAARERILYEGFKAPHELPKYFAMADAFVLPSRHDGWGVVVNQALGAGLPVITTDAVGAGLDLVEPQVNGLRCPAGNIERLENAMKILAEDPLLAAKWGEVSRAKALGITPEAGARKWLETFAILKQKKTAQQKAVA